MSPCLTQGIASLVKVEEVLYLLKELKFVNLLEEVIDLDSVPARGVRDGLRLSLRSCIRTQLEELYSDLVEGGEFQFGSRKRPPTLLKETNSDVA